MIFFFPNSRYIVERKNTMINLPGLYQTEEQRKAFARSPEFIRSMNSWNTGYHGSRNKVGSVMAAVRNVQMKDATVEDFWNYYIREVKPYDTVIALIEEYQRVWACSMEFATNVWFYRVIEQSWNGWKKELEAKAIIEAHFAKVRPNYRIEHATDEEDTDYAVDFIVWNKTERVSAIQVKGISYVTGNQSSTVKARTITNPDKNKKYSLRYGVDVFYVFTEDLQAGNIKFTEAQTFRLDTSNKKARR